MGLCGSTSRVGTSLTISPDDGSKRHSDTIAIGPDTSSNHGRRNSGDVPLGRATSSSGPNQSNVSHIFSSPGNVGGRRGSAGSARKTGSEVVAGPYNYGEADVPAWDPGHGTGSAGSVHLRQVPSLESAYEAVGDDVLGRGSFGEVTLGRRIDASPDAPLYAIKKIKPNVRVLTKKRFRKVVRASTVARRAMMLANQASQRRQVGLMNNNNEATEDSKSKASSVRRLEVLNEERKSETEEGGKKRNGSPPASPEGAPEKNAPLGRVAAEADTAQGGARAGAGGGGGETNEKKARSVIAESKASGLHEADIMNRVRGHEHVVNICDLLEDDTNVYIVMDYCAGGDLMKYLVRCKNFSEKVASSLFRQMLLAVAHCHSRGVVHRDIKPENFLFRSKEGTAHLLLADFGLATTISSYRSVMTEGVGSAFFIAPEVLAKRYTLACDLWSLGVILYLLLSGKVPFGNGATKATEVYHAIRHDRLSFPNKQWSRISPAVRELIAGLLEKAPYRRYTAAQALNHPWIRFDGVAPDEPLQQDVIDAMHHFNARNRFRRQALRMVASTLGAEDLQRLRAQFHAIDKDTDMAISYHELAQALAELNIEGGPDLDTLMREMDFDGDGRIDFEEFITATAELQVLDHQNNMWWAFCQCDRNNDGRISADELRRIMQGENEEAIRKYMAEYDRDGDGQIDYEEFIRMLVPPNLEFHTISMV